MSYSKHPCGGHTLFSLRWGFVAAALLSAAMPAAAHLCIIRQGPDSAGAIEAGDQYGFAIASGDFNGDGFADLAVGSPYEDVGTNSNAGAVVISYGCPTGLTQVGAQIRTQDSIGATSEANDNFGYALAVGNFNNDAYDDLAIGSPGESIAGLDDAGNVVVLLGSASGLQASGFTISQGNTPGAVEAGDIFGFSLAAGDFNDDNRDDLAVGSPGEDLFGPPAVVDAGAITLLFGSAGGITTAGAYVLTDNDTINAAQAGAVFGWALAAGLFNSDDRADLVVGIPRKNVSGFTSHGVIEVLFAAPTGIAAAGAQLLSQVSFGGTNAAGDQFGYTLATGNVDDDRYDDVAIGAPFKSGSGRVYMTYGGTSGLRTDNADFITPATSSAGDDFGIALALGDYDDDGFDDLAIGVPGRTADQGAAWIFGGSTTGVPTSTNGQLLRTPAILNEVGENGDRLGAALAFGAFAGGTREGLALGAPTEDWDPLPGNPAPAQPDAGAVYVDLPWLQVQSLTSRNCILTNCANDIVFSQKPFEPQLLASTSKIMTLLVACEATQPGCNPCASLADIYTVPTVLCNRNAWPGGSLGGSLANLCPGETISLQDLFYGMMYPSGNDAAFSIADHLVDPNNNCANTNCADVLDFVDLMNDRAASLSMTATVYENPSGGAHPSWASNNISSPENQARLAFTAMQNQLFRTVVGGTTWSLQRFDNCFPNGTTMTTWNTGVFIMPGGATPDFPNASGIKPGGTGAAGNTLVCAVNHPDGEYFCVVLGEPSNAAMRTDMTALLTLGSNVFCQVPFIPPPPYAGTLQNAPDVPANAGSRTTIHFPLYEETDRAFNVRVTPGSGNASATLRLNRSIQMQLQPGKTGTLTVAPALARGAISIQNVGNVTISLLLTYNHPTMSQSLVLAGGGEFVIPAHAPAVGGPGVATLTLLNAGGSTADLDIYELDHQLPVATTVGGPAANVRMTADPQTGECSVEVVVDGLDSSATDTIDLLLANTLDGDPGCNGVLDVGDVPAFVSALVDPENYAADFPGCYIGSADLNDDGYINGLDVQPFIDIVLAPVAAR